MELAIEFVKVGDDGHFERYRSGAFKVLGGLYLSGGSLYIDATEIVNNAESYARIDNFVSKGRELIDQIGGIVDGITKPNQADEALTATEYDSESQDLEKLSRDAIIALAYSDTAFQIQFTRSLLAFIVATLMPELGSIEEVFDILELSVGVELGEVQYKRVSEIKDPAEKDKWDTVWNDERYNYYTDPSPVHAVELEDYYVAMVNGVSKYYPSYTSLYVKNENGTYDKVTDGYNPDAGITYYVDEAGLKLEVLRVVKAQKADKNYYVVAEGSGATVSLKSYDLFEKVGG